MNGTNKLSILMLGGARRVSMAELLIESGKRMGYDVEILSYELTPEVPIAIVGKVIVGLKWGDPEVINDIARVAEENKLDIILPFVDGAIDIAARCRARLPHVFIPVSEADTATLMFDKVEAAKAFKEAALPIPKTYNVLNAELPAIAKPRHGSSSKGIKVFHNMADLMHLENIKNYLIQEYITNMEEYTVDCYVTQEGEILCTVPRIRLEVMGGEVTRTRTCHLPEMEDMAHKVIDFFHLRGPVTLQFLHDLDKERFLLMEINPRLGGGVICSIKAGAPIPDYIIGEALHQKLTKCDDWRNNTLMTRFWKEMIF
jgi:carbamoyl-phosphate synthase large subunit